MRIILCYPPHKAEDGYGQGREWFPIGIASLAAYLDAHGHKDIICLDLFEQTHDEALSTILSNLDENEQNLVGFTMMTEQRFVVIDLIDDLQQRISDINSIYNTTTTIKTMVGGPHPSIMYQQLADNYDIDFIIVGEGELGIKYVIDRLNSNDPGLYPEKIIKQGQVNDLNELPHAFEGLKYFKPELNITVAPIVFSRGCTDRCAFCTTYKTWKGYRTRSAYNVLQEILKFRHMGITKFKFHDDSATANQDEFLRFCQYVNEYNIQFEITARADQLNKDLIRWLALAGCYKVALGLESGNEELRKSMGKRLDIEKAKENIQMLNLHNIQTHGLFIIGWPGENENTIEETAELIRQVQVQTFSHLPGLMVLPGTPIYNKLKKDKWIDDSYWLKREMPPYYTGEHTKEQLAYFGYMLRSGISPKTVLIAAVVNQDERVFKAYLDALDALELPKNVVVKKLFILHNSNHLKKYLKEDEYIISNNDICHDMMHKWDGNKLKFIAESKNVITKIAKSAATHIFWVDSDLIVHPKTLKHLLTYDVNIIGEIFWTKWPLSDGGDKFTENELPNAWSYDQYTFSYNPEIFRTPGVYYVGGTGACILVNTSIYNEYVNYNSLANVSFSVWEDRAFCIRAAVQGHSVFLDTHYPAKHLYTKEITDAYFEEVKT